MVGARNEAEVRITAARRLLDAIDDGRWPRRSTDLVQVARVLKTAAECMAAAEEGE